MALLRPLALAAATLVLVACDPTRRPTPVEAAGGRPSVYAVLGTGDSTARVLLVKLDAGPAGSARSTAILQPVTGAEVWLLAGGDSLALEEAAEAVPPCMTGPGTLGPDSVIAGPGCYTTAVPGGIRAGERYTLHIRFPDGSTAAGTAVPPAAPVLLAPAAGTRVPTDAAGVTTYGGVRIDLRWSAGTEAAAWWSTLLVGQAFRGDTLLVRAYCGFDNLPWLSAGNPLQGTLSGQPPGCSELANNGYWQPVAWDSITARVRLAVYDTAYARYFAQAIAGPVFERDASVGIRGAPGVFGATAAAEVPVLVVH